MSDPDIINTLAGLAPDSRLAQIRDRRPVTRENAQASFRALFEPAEPGTVALQERFAIASFVAGLHAQDDLAAFYTARLLRTTPAEAFVVALSAEADRGRTGGPYGAYPNGPLTVEDVLGPIYQAAETNRTVLGGRLSAAPSSLGRSSVTLRRPIERAMLMAEGADRRPELRRPTCRSSTRAMPALLRSRRYAMPAGRKPISSRCHNSWHSLLFRSAQSPAYGLWP